MHPNDDVVDRRLRLGPIDQLYPGHSRSLICCHNRLHRSPPCVELWPAPRHVGFIGINLLDISSLCWKYKPSSELAKPHKELRNHMELFLVDGTYELFRQTPRVSRSCLATCSGQGGDFEV